MLSAKTTTFLIALVNKQIEDISMLRCKQADSVNEKIIHQMDLEITRLHSIANELLVFSSTLSSPNLTNQKLRLEETLELTNHLLVSSN